MDALGARIIESPVPRLLNVLWLLRGYIPRCELSFFQFDINFWVFPRGTEYRMRRVEFCVRLLSQLVC